jgi:BirA family biotin operon repressor/biotin-[acetyl-CoA-carboxylase] ligase
MRKKILNILADGEFHSGTELSATLKVTRSAIWKQMGGLEEYGIEIIAVSGKGYRLPRAMELLNQTTIINSLAEHAEALLSELLIYDKINSTNHFLVEQINQGGSSGLVCLSECQESGKGRRGRQWVSPFGCNIYLSILWHYQKGPAAISALSLALGVAVIRALARFSITSVGLKWPNDIYWQGQKLGGILVEVIGESEGPCSVVSGIGLNMFLPEKEAENIQQSWTDLSRIMESPVPCRNELVAALINELLPVIADFENNGFAKYLHEWRSYDCMTGKDVTLHLGNRQFEGVVQGIDDSGMLVLNDTEGRTNVYACGEVSFSHS